MLERVKRLFGLTSKPDDYLLQLLEEKYFAPVSDLDASFKLGLPKERDERNFARAYGEIVWVYVAVKAIADTIGMLPLRIYETVQSSQGFQKREVTSGFIWNLINYPAPYSGAVEFKQVVAGSFALTGNSYIYVDVDDDHLIVLHPQDVKIVANKETFIDHYLFTPNSTFHNPIKLDPHRVIHAKTFNPDDYFYGTSPIQSAWRQVNFQDKESDYWNIYWREGGRLQGIFSTEASMSKEDKDRVEKELRKRYGGVSKMQRSLILDKNLKFQQIGLSPKDAMTIDKLKMTREDILAVYSVPPGIAGIMELSNYSNMEVQERIFYKRAIMPITKLIEEALNNNQILSLDRKLYFEFDYSDIDCLKENEKLKAEIGEILIRSGQMTQNEVRSEYWELDPMADGNVLKPVVQENLNPFQLSLDEQKEKMLQIEKTLIDVMDTVIESVEPETPQLNTPLKPFKKVYSEEDRERIAKEFDSDLAEYDNQIMKATKDNFSKQEKVVLANLRKELKSRGDFILKESSDIDALLAGLEDTAADFAKDLEKSYESVMEKFGQRAVSFIESQAKKAKSDYQAKAAFNFTDSRIAKFIKARSIGVAGITTRTTLNQLREIIAAKFLESATIPEIADTIEAYFTVASSSRAATIARTETGAAANEAIHSTWEQNRDVVKGREWVTARDGDVRDSHKIDGYQKPLGELFELKDGEKCEYPQAPGMSAGNAINCRCTTVPLLDFED